MDVGLTQKQGHVAGKLFFAATLAGLATAVTSRRPEGIVVAVASAFTGVWLHTKLYMGDPAAREEYKRQLSTRPFSVSLEKMGIEAILQLVAAEECRAFFVKEFGGGGLRYSWVYAAYQAKWLKVCLGAKIVLLSDLTTALQGDLRVAKKAAVPFTSLWSIVGKDGLTFLHTLSILPLSELRQLLDVEYDYPGGRTGHVATAPDSSDCDHNGCDTNCSKSNSDVKFTFKNIGEYANFCMDILQVSRAYVVAMVQSSRLGRESTYTVLLDCGLFSLFQDGFADPTWCTEKLAQDVRLYQPQLEQLERHVRVSRQLSSGMITDATLFAPVFTMAIPTSPFSNSMTAKHNVVAFLEHHEELLTTYGKQIVAPHMWGHVVWVKGEWERAKINANERFEEPQRPKAASKKVSTNDAPGSKQNEADEVARMVAEHLSRVEELKRKKVDFLLNSRKELHAKFCSRVADASAKSEWF